MAKGITETAAESLRAADTVNTERLTTEQFRRIQRAFDFLNRELFKKKGNEDGELPAVFIILQRKANCGGYFAENRIEVSGGGKSKTKETVHELALNPEHFESYGQKGVLAVLAHEMVHLWQTVHGEHKPRRGYHNREWSEKMIQIGLRPICADPSRRASEPRGGIPSGQSMTHEIIKNGRFDKAADKFLKENGDLIMIAENWRREKGGSNRDTKVKMICDCGKATAWAKPTADLLCGKCHTQLKPVRKSDMPAGDDSEAEDDSED